MDRCYRKQTCWKVKSFETKRYLGRSDFPSHNAAEYIEHAQFLAMDYPNMLTAVTVRNNCYLLRRNYAMIINIAAISNVKDMRHYWVYH